jgi:hypothetical protein
MLHGAVVSGKTIHVPAPRSHNDVFATGLWSFSLGSWQFRSKREPLEWHSFILSDKLAPTDCHFCEIKGARLLSDKDAREFNYAKEPYVRKRADEHSLRCRPVDAAKHPRRISRGCEKMLRPHGQEISSADHW